MRRSRKKNWVRRVFEERILLVRWRRRTVEVGRKDVMMEMMSIGSDSRVDWGFLSKVREGSKRDEWHPDLSGIVSN